MDNNAESQVGAWLSINASDGNSSVARFFLRRLVSRGSRYAGTGQDWLCPSHQDTKPSLGVSLGNDGRILLKCQAGCDLYDILRALELAESDLFVPKPPHKPIAEIYDYRTAKGELLYQVMRHDPKGFGQRHLEGTRAVWSLDGISPVLYRLPELRRELSMGKRIYIAEGEKDVATLRAHGLAATCNPGGAGKWKDEYAEILAGAHVVVIADLDRAGVQHAKTVEASLLAHGCAVGIVQPKSGKDASDHFGAGFGKDDFEDLTWEPPAHENPETPEGDSTSAGNDAPIGDDDFEREVNQKLRRLKVDQEANRRFRATGFAAPEFTESLQEELRFNDVHSEFFTA